VAAGVIAVISEVNVIKEKSQIQVLGLKTQDV
jgi:hypothetical protein